MMEYVANTANMPGTEENSARFSSGKKKVHFLSPLFDFSLMKSFLDV